MRTKDVIKHIITWLTDYSDSSKTNGFVVGISGGIDSAITSTLCALSGKNTLCILLPIHQNEQEFNRSSEHAKWLTSKFSNVTVCKVDLTETFDTLSKEIPSEIKSHLTMANTRARIRMTTLYTFAGSKGMLVAGTGNKVEDFGVGFYTKYGDGGVDLSPIADLLKSEIQEIAKYLKINSDIINTPPTDGLWENNRTDEEQIGASYLELEWAMNFKGNLESLSKRKKQVLEIYKAFNKKNQHKMNPIPICIIPKKYKI